MIEISRTASFGRYIDNGSPLTRLDPRAKIVCALLLIGTLSYVSHFSALLIGLAGCIVLHFLSRLPLLYVLRSLRFFFIFLLILYVIQVVFYTSPTQASSLIWHWGILTLSWEGLAHSAQISIRVLLLYYLTLLLMFSTSLVDLADGAEALLLPLRYIGVPVHELVMIFIVALKSVPLLMAEVERLSIAQAMRGVRFGRGNPVQRVYAMSGLLVPLFLSSLQRVESLSTAMEARCYRGGYRGWRRSKRRELRLTSVDLLALTSVFLLSAAMLAAHLLSHV
jgi:energy-coupling factor transport system permease protein